MSTSKHLTPSSYMPTYFYLSTVTGWRTLSWYHWRNSGDTHTLRTCVCWMWHGTPMNPSSSPRELMPPFVCGTEGEQLITLWPVETIYAVALVCGDWQLWMHKHWLLLLKKRGAGCFLLLSLWYVHGFICNIPLATHLGEKFLYHRYGREALSCAMVVPMTLNFLV